MQRTSELPPYDERGNLPVGTYKVTIDVVIDYFGGTKSMRRHSIGKNLIEFYKLIRPLAKAVYVDGSFITNKLSPGDVDLFVIISNRAKQNVNSLKIIMSYLKSHRKLHVQFCYDSDLEKTAGWINFFTTTRSDENGRQFQKGIIELELEND